MKRKNKIDKKRENEIIVLSQIFIFIIGFIAIAYSIGSEVKFVSGAGASKTTEATPYGGIYTGIGGVKKPKIIGDSKGTGAALPVDKGVKTVETPATIDDWEKYFIDNPAAEETPFSWKGFRGHLASGFQLAFIIAGAIYFIAPMLGASGGLTKALTISTFGGILVGKTATPYWGNYGTLAGIGVGLVLFYMFYKEETKKVVTFTCLAWQAPIGGTKCEECNKQGVLPCSEYQCRSLGQACELINVGTDKEQCVWVNKNDVEYPTIQLWEEALLEDYEYSPDNTISPPDRGVKIEYTPSTSKCVKAFTPLSFGVTLNEPAKCKIDIARKKNFEEMAFYFSGGLSLYNHSYTLSLPGLAALNSENITIQNNGEYELAVKCQDANGNFNTADFVFKFCVEEGPDTTPPLIVTTSIPSGNPIAYEQTSVDIDVYVNEPSDCRWSHVDQSYEDMENEMDCSSSVFEMNAQMLYTCTTTLTGLKNREENKFYFRCKDDYENTNKESYKFSLMGTQPLVIDWAKPDDTTIKDATESIQVTLEAQTSAGYNEGEATCYYSETGETEDYITFFNTNSYQHSQDLWLGEGDYTYYIKCIDLGGNEDVETITFTVESDASPPLVVRAYHEETYLKLVTSEPARCVYDTKYTNYPCDYLFEDGIEMTAVDDVTHYTEWNTALTLYIKCEDGFGSQPDPDQCSIIIRPSEI